MITLPFATILFVTSHTSIHRLKTPQHKRQPQSEGWRFGCRRSLSGAQKEIEARGQATVGDATFGQAAEDASMEARPSKRQVARRGNGLRTVHQRPLRRYTRDGSAGDLATKSVGLEGSSSEDQGGFRRVGP
jgi:hypothetical protein